ncbi:putative NUDIX family NTP pyrophosphohydrolase [Rhodoligotrophos appendicifer]|uniref:NUDIX domain-containing protein n=1 Tax=Rhodoligotrophos appendicifer TaxID=987056 RepID=UPI0011859A67|nr:NUDIX domain-containing protein [Rhodoligotrophos appendicifer]
MAVRSAGIVLYQVEDGEIFVLLVHPGGPFWRRRDLGAWSIPKGQYGREEDPEDAARREFSEEVGCLPECALQPLGSIRQGNGKQVTAFAAEAAFDPAEFRSNSFEMEWPARSGSMQSFPEVDRVEWFALPVAQRKILKAQQPLLERLQALVLGRG